MTTLSPTAHRESASANLWKGAGVTAFVAVLFPRVNAVMYDHEKIWQLDHEAAVLAPLVVVLALVIFATVGPYALRGTANRPARASVICSIVAVLGVVAFWMSVPITLGGLAVTLGLEGRRRAPELGRGGLATAGTVIGAVAAIGGAALWLVGA
ncbi:MAG: hypothetical protein QOG79_2363 [Mycobacterium sp.]|jgi:hypothetical protein|nr:hypothetical protein [Mycobacterium sp.]